MSWDGGVCRVLVPARFIVVAVVVIVAVTAVRGSDPSSSFSSSCTVLVCHGATFHASSYHLAARWWSSVPVRPFLNIFACVFVGRGAGRRARWFVEGQSFVGGLIRRVLLRPGGI